MSRLPISRLMNPFPRTLVLRRPKVRCTNEVQGAPYHVCIGRRLGFDVPRVAYPFVVKSSLLNHESGLYSSHGLTINSSSYFCCALRRSSTPRQRNQVDFQVVRTLSPKNLKFVNFISPENCTVMSISDGPNKI